MKYRITDKTPDWLKFRAKRKVVEMSASAAAIHLARGELTRMSVIAKVSGDATGDAGEQDDA